MNTGPHGRARDLIARDRIEGISAAENAWLESHLAECSGCREIAETTAGALRAVRAFSVTLPAELAERARLRLYWHTSQQGQNRPRQRALWAACVVSWIGGAATSPFVWRGFEWIGRQAGVPDPVWKMGFALWWGLPALFAAAALFLHPTALAAYRRR